MPNQFAKLDHKLTDEGVIAMLSGSEFKVYCVLLRRADYNERTCFPTIKRIARDSGLYSRRIHQIVKNLEQYGLITVKRTPGSYNVYYLRETITADIVDRISIARLSKPKKTNYRIRNLKGEFTTPQNKQGTPQKEQGPTPQHTQWSHPQNVDNKENQIKENHLKKIKEGESTVSDTRFRNFSNNIDVSMKLSDEKIFDLIADKGHRGAYKILIQNGFNPKEATAKLKEIF